MKKIVVIGSINMDLVTICDRAPNGGETLLGTEFFQIPGGKGANQAVTIGKLGSRVVMLGKVGDDLFGKELLSSMDKNGVDIQFIEKAPVSTGIAKIVVEKNGQNRILVVPGANSYVDIEYIDNHLDVIKDCDVVIGQLEIPISTVEYAFKKAKEYGKITILNPAPAIKLSEELIKNSDYIIPNESELEVITGMKIESFDGIIEAAKKVIKMGVKGLILTLGEKGSLYLGSDKFTKHSAYKVKAIDTTAAGDSFIGGFVTRLDLGVDKAIEFATKVSAISVTKRGAQTSIPTMEEVENFVGEKIK
ncbi:ribokinase [uncultured Fusobacterium sp.]|uniref:ribokinase n=1 Tax=uncultured Fusobacterium sp. TaxID=159267 RepID=UPI00258B6370|nr:ribokinase [uncultured Fusobacterium sp.]